MEGLAQRLTRSFLRRGIITAEQTEWCAYILECKLDQWSAFAVMAVVGTVLAGFPQTVLFLWGICFLRNAPTATMPIPIWNVWSNPWPVK